MGGVWVFWARIACFPCFTPHLAPCSSKCSTFVHCNLGLVNWLCCSLVKQTKSGSVTHQNHKSWCPDQWMGIWSKWTRFRTLNVEQRQKKGLVAVPYKLASVSIYWDPELLLVPSWVFSLPVSSLSCLPTLQGFPGGSAGKESACNVGDPLIPGLGRSPGEGTGYPFQYSGLEKSMDCIVQGVAKSWTPLSNFHFPFPTLPVNYCYSANPDSNWYRQPREATQMTDTHTQKCTSQRN